MVDPSDITNYQLTPRELEETLLFWILAAGKNGTVAAKQLHKLMCISGGYVIGPFEALRLLIDKDELIRKDHHNAFPNRLKRLGVGCYNNKARAIKDLVYRDLDLSTCTSEQLEQVFGIGRKSARCFIIHSRQGARYAGLDRHILEFLSIVGVDKVPRSTPSSKKEYLRLEAAFLWQADKCNKTSAELDLIIWNELKVVNKVTN